jgi:hypothetical protein
MPPRLEGWLVPPAVIAVGSAALAASAAYSAGIVIFGTTLVAAGVGAAVLAGGSVLALSAASGGFSSPKKPGGAVAPSIANVATDRTLSIRQAITARRRAYGIVRLSGVQTFVHVTGSSKEYLHMVVTMSGHPFRSIQALLLDDEIVPLDGDGNATGRYADFVRAKFGLGTTATDSGFMADLIANCPDKWTSAHKQTGCSKLYIRLKFDRDIFPGSLPNISVIADTAYQIEDPRVSISPSEYAFTDNWALCVADYLLTPTKDGGLGASWDEIDIDDLIAAANASDEMAARKTASVTFTVDASTDQITVADKTAALRLGTRFTVSSTGALPGGSSAATNYFWIPTGYTTGKLASSLDNARAGTSIDLTDAGTGTHTLTVNAEPRYTLNGSFDTSEQPQGILQDMLTAGAGALVWSGGKWHIYAGVWRSSTASFDKGDTDGGLTVQTRRSRRDLANGIKGVFANPDDNYQPTDLPPYLGSGYVEEDNGEEIWLDYELPFTNSPSAGQRIHRIVLERNRRQIACKWPLNLRGLKAQAMSTVSLSNDLWGWTDKTFEVAGFNFAVREGRKEGEAPRYGTDLTLSEIDANVFAWDPTVNEGTLVPAPTTNLPDPFDVSAPSPPVVVEEKYETSTGRGVATKAKLSWLASEDAFVEVYQAEFRLVGATDWIVIKRDSLTTAEVLDMAPGVYDFRVKGITGLRVSSDYATTRQEIYGLGDTPATPTIRSLQKFGGQAYITLDLHPDLDVRIGGRLLVRHSEATSNAEWSESFSIGDPGGYAGSSVNLILPLKSGSYLVRAEDSSGIQSSTWAQVSTDGADIREFADVATVQEDDDFLGEKDGVVVDGTILKLAGAGLFDDIPDFDDVASLDDYGGIGASGTYYFAAGFDFTTKSRRRLRSIIDGIVVNSNDLIDSRTDNIDDWVDFDGDDGGSAADCWVEARTTDDDPASSPASWTAWSRVDSTEVYCRGVELRSQHRSTDTAYNIYISQLRVKAEELA